jgi:hypothetical protein
MYQRYGGSYRYLRLFVSFGQGHYIDVLTEGVDHLSPSVVLWRRLDIYIINITDDWRAVEWRTDPIRLRRNRSGDHS